MMVKGEIAATRVSDKTVQLDRQQSTRIAEKYGDSVAKAVQKAAAGGKALNKTALVALLTTKGSKLDLDKARKEADRIFGDAKARPAQKIGNPLKNKSNKSFDFDSEIKKVEAQIKPSDSAKEVKLGKAYSPSDFKNQGKMVGVKSASDKPLEKTKEQMKKEWENKPEAEKQKEWDAELQKRGIEIKDGSKNSALASKASKMFAGKSSQAQQVQIQREDLRRSLEDPKWGNSEERLKFLAAGMKATTAQKALQEADRQRAAKDPKWRTSPERLSMLKGSVETDKDTAGNSALAGKMMEAGAVSNPLKAKSQATKDSADNAGKTDKTSQEVAKQAGDSLKAKSQALKEQQNSGTEQQPSKEQPKAAPADEKSFRRQLFETFLPKAAKAYYEGQGKKEQAQTSAPASNEKSFKRLLFEAFLPKTADVYYTEQKRRAVEKAKDERKKAAEAKAAEKEAAKMAKEQAKEQRAEEMAGKAAAREQARIDKQTQRDAQAEKRAAEQAAKQEARAKAQAERQAAKEQRAQEQSAKKAEKEKAQAARQAAKEERAQQQAAKKAEREKAKADRQSKSNKGKSDSDVVEEVRTPQGELLGHLMKNNSIRLLDGTIVPADK